MKKIILIIVLLSSITCLKAQDYDTINDNIREYANELGFFQKAHRDLSDPRFMFHDPDRGVDFGLGGTTQIGTFYEFFGNSNLGSNSSSSEFNPANITVPTDKTPNFGSFVGGCELHAKSRVTWQDHKMIAYLKMGADDNGGVSISQVYISIDNFSFGKIPSFFIDLESGVNCRFTVSPQADLAQTLFGYTYRTKNNWEFAAALEHANVDVDDYGITHLKTDYQPLPDFSGHIKYRWENGHIQLGCVLRNMTYWATDNQTVYYQDGDNKHTLGYGLALSGNFKCSPKLLVSYNLLGGCGLAKYMSYFAGLRLDLGVRDEMDGRYMLMAGVPLASFSLGVQYKWNNYITSSFLTGHAQCFEKDGLYNIDPTRCLDFFSFNTYWNLSDFMLCGIEYYYGTKTTYRPVESNNIQGTQGPVFGQSHRVTAVIAYMF